MSSMKQDPEKEENKPVDPTPGDETVEVATGEDERDSFYIVGIGGSAGALEAFEQFFHVMPHDTGLAFVLVPHLDPTHKGIMPELLQRFTSMKVHQARDGLAVQPDNVYVIPPNKDMAIMHGVLQLLEPAAPRGLRLPIDFFFRHLAEDQKERSIGIILSGMGTDGTLGLRAIKEQMGTVMVQDPGSAKYDGMPRSAVSTGIADFVAPIEELPQKLVGFVSHYSRIRSTAHQFEKKTPGAFQKVILMLRMRTGNDFFYYKKNTLQRRIDRRMSIHQIESMAQYVNYLQENEQEIDLLFKELLIGVTNFFRDPEAFEAMAEKAITPLVRGKLADDVIRVWVPGCSTGEEVYSLAILIGECLEREQRMNVRVQIYGTDIDQEAINFARKGSYAASITADVSPERLARFFVKDDGTYRVKKEIREMVVFAPQNLISDPPFTRLDLVSCRNLLIYITSETQKKLVPILHYTLRTGGFLFLGPSETVSGFNDLFKPVDGKWKIFSRRESASALTALPEFSLMARTRDTGRQHLAESLTRVAASTLQESVQRIIVESVAPPVLLINEKGDLIYATRRTGKYLEPSVGKAALNVFEMAREGLKFELAISVRTALSKKTDVHIKGLEVKTNGDTQTVNVTVRPITGDDPLKGLVMVIFEDAPARPRNKRKKTGDDTDAHREIIISEIEKELQYTREHLQSTIEQMETSQEEIKTANEELQSTNEELQSTNEELTTSKEELQSMNEELITLNAELQTKNDELSMTNNDMRNLLNSTQIPTLFLDNDLNIKRFTQHATSIFTLIASDIGRPITDISSSLEYENLVADVNSVLELLMFKEAQACTKDGRWYTIRIMPYRTMDNMIDGVVITFNDISIHKMLEETLRENRDRLAVSEFRYRALVESLPHLIWECAPDGACDYIGPQWTIYTGVPGELLTGYRWGSRVHPDEWQEIKKKWIEMTAGGDRFELLFRIMGAGGQYRHFRVAAVPLKDHEGKLLRWFCTGMNEGD